MAERITHIDDLQASRAADSQHVNREVAIRHALGVLAPSNDDAAQPYAELLRRLKAAIEVELEKIS